MYKKISKYLIYGFLFLLDLWFLYSTIGYFILGYNTPKIYGETNTIFMGMYILSITFGVCFLVLTLSIAISLIIIRKKRKEHIDNKICKW